MVCANVDVDLLIDILELPTRPKPNISDVPISLRTPGELEIETFSTWVTSAQHTSHIAPFTTPVDPSHNPDIDT